MILGDAVAIAAMAATLLLAARAHSQEAASRAVAMRLYLLDCGTLKARDGLPYGLSLEQVPPRDLSNPCALVVHPRGTLLWETGLHESVNATPPLTQPPRPGRPRPGDRVDKPLKQQLAEIGYAPSDITYLALSHAHWDHTGNVRDYLGSVWLVQKSEREAMFGSIPAPNRADYEGLKESRARVLDGDHDVFGDGAVRLIFTPGHTPGHQSLFLRLPNTGAVLLAGDLYHFPEELTLKPAPAGRTAAAVASSKAKVQALIAATRAQLWIQHDARGFSMLEKSPAYYD